MQELPYWLALSRISVLGARRIPRLVEVIGSAEKAFTADVDALVAAGLPAQAAAAMAAERKAVDPHREFQRLTSAGFDAVLVNEERYPKILREISDPPAVLFYRGDFTVLEHLCVSLVGSRKATAYGKAVADRLSADLAAFGVTVVSGMARGIDTAAHLGVLRAGGRTAAVLGCGLDVCYPPENKKLRDEIERQGVILSEFPLGTQPKPPHFPMRNRIISGLSLAVIIVEAAERSGALITADCALEQGREVLAVPGSIYSPASRGCHRLIKEGAALVESAADVLAALGVRPFDGMNNERQNFTPTQQKVLQFMEYEPVHFDELVTCCGLAAEDLAVSLLELELLCAVKKMPGNHYLRV
ncbi:MAG: DNA-processing protein DprA [Dethiobacter sp.]|nr:DNA-processing protein DprA [Dethiobacter sp.]MBS3900637.1 DNA-processing protein DprA [Dethiobacter sp.]MBS3989641.1 DNA-processing protein DprA [Dethiobacter sp.]